VSCDGSFYYASLYRTGCSSESSTGALVEEVEPNDTAGSANPVQLGDDYRGEIASGTDLDFVSFSAAEGTVLRATLVLDTLPSAELALFDPDGGQLAFDTSQIVFSIPRSGTYYVGIASFPSQSTG